MIADLFAMFTDAKAKPETPANEVIEAEDPQPREPVAHPFAKPRPANARSVYPHFMTNGGNNTPRPEATAFESTMPQGPIEPQEPVAHPFAKPRPANARSVYPRITTTIEESDQEEEYAFEDMVPMGSIDPKEPVAHPSLKPHPMQLGRKSAR